MKLTQICIHIPKSKKNTLVDRGRAATVTTAMYGYYLKDYQTDGVKRVSISLITDQSKQNLILPLESVLMYSRIFVDGEKYND